MEYPEFYNRHYIRTREDGAITDGWSDGPHREKDTGGATCISKQGGYQFRLVLEGGLSEENPCLFNMFGIPLFRWDGAKAVPRDPADVQKEVDAIPPPPPSEMEKLRADTDYLLMIDDTEQLRADVDYLLLLTDFA